MPETCTRRCTPDARECFATLVAASTCTERNVWLPRSTYRLTALTTPKAPTSAVITDPSSPTSALTNSNAEEVLEKTCAPRSGCRDATLTAKPWSRRCWTTRLPRKPVPPKTVTFRVFVTWLTIVRPAHRSVRPAQALFHDDFTVDQWRSAEKGLSLKLIRDSGYAPNLWNSALVARQRRLTQTWRRFE